MADLIQPPGLHGEQLLPRDVADLLYRNGWLDAYANVKMNATVAAESGRYVEAVGAVNANGSQDWGLFQLNNRHYQKFGYANQEAFYLDAISPEKAAPLARQLFNDDRKAGGSGFRPWAAFGNKNWTAEIPPSCGGLANCVSLDLIGKKVV